MLNDFKITLLGTGTPKPAIDRFGPSTLIEAGKNRILIDCGRGTMQRIHQIDTNASTFDKLFLTHLHSDHTTGIPDLWITGTLRQRLKNPLKIWGPKGTKDMIYHIKEAFKVDTLVRREAHEMFGGNWEVEGLRIIPHEIDEEFIYSEDGVTVIPFRVNHHDAYSTVMSLGYRIEYDGKCVVISGDTCYCENLIKYSKDVDLLIHEVCTLPVGEVGSDRFRLRVSHHTLPEDCGKVFSAVGPKLAVFYHFVQFPDVSLDGIMERTRSEYDGPVVFGEDMMQIEIGDSVKILNR
jgi:ribonuclease Z